MAVAMTTPRVLARAVCVWSLASARGGHGFTAATPSVASAQCPSRGVPRFRRSCSAKSTVRDAETAAAYEVHPVAGDGRCLFRSVAIALALHRGEPRLSPTEETAEADRLRSAAVDDIRKRRDEVEWYIEGDFEAYCAHMRRPNAWGGEPEILSLARVLKITIEVFMADSRRQTDSPALVRSIAAYRADDVERREGEAEDVGSSFSDRIAVVFRGEGHYEALTKGETETIEG